MRKVECFVDKYEYEGNVRKQVTDRYTGVFHQWGVEYEEFENGPGNYSVAIVEMPDGKVRTFPPYKIKFLE